MTIVDQLNEERLKIWNEAQALNKKVTSEKRVMSSDEQIAWDQMNADIDAKDAQIKAETERELKFRAREAEFARVNNPGVGRPNAGARHDGEPRELRYRLPFTGGERVIPFSNRLTASPEYGRAFSAYLRGGRDPLSMPEFRALQADVDASGGYTFATEQFVARVIMGIDNLVFMRQLATVIPVTESDSIGAPTLSADPADADWTSELLIGSEDSTMAFGKRQMATSPLAKYIKVSNKLFRVSALNIEQFVIDRLAYKFAVSQEKAYLSGSGSGQPLGVFTASGNGISTGRDVSTGNSTSAIAADNLFECKYSIKAPHWPNLRWIFSRTAVKNIRKLKDGEGQYLWQPGLQGGQPDRILDAPVLVSEYCPATFTTGLYVGIIGDFSYYWIADLLSMQVQRLVELFAATNQVGFVLRTEFDGAPVLEEAFARVKLA